MPLQHEELVRALHQIGRLYWQRPDTADCLVRVVRLCSCQHSHQRLRHEHSRHCDSRLLSTSVHPEVQRGIGHRRFEESCRSAPISATASTSTFQLDRGPDRCRNPRNLHEPALLPEPKHWTDGDDNTSRKRPRHETDHHEQRYPDRRSTTRTDIGESSQDQANVSSPTRSTYTAPHSPPVSNPKHDSPAEVPGAKPKRENTCSPDPRRESAPSSMCGAATAAARTVFPGCAHCCSHSHAQDRGGTMFLLHKDFLTTQSALFKELLQANNDPTDPSTRKPTDNVVNSNGNAVSVKKSRQTCITVALPDPGSFDVLVEYFYMGDFSKLAATLDSGIVRWENVMLNAQHLGLSSASKMQLGAWWRLRQGRFLQQQKIQRASLPATSPGRPSAGSAALMQPLKSATRPRAYTTGSGQQVGPHRTSMFPSNAHAALPNAAARPSSRERKRSRDWGVAEAETALHRHSHGNRGVPAQHEPPPSLRPSTHHLSRPIDTVSSTLIPMLGKSGYSSPGMSPRTTGSPSEVERLVGKGEHHPSAVRQLLLGGTRRRALSNLAYYCSTEAPSNRAAPVKP